MRSEILEATFSEVAISLITENFNEYFEFVGIGVLFCVVSGIILLMTGFLFISRTTMIGYLVFTVLFSLSIPFLSAFGNGHVLAEEWREEEYLPILEELPSKKIEIKEVYYLPYNNSANYKNFQYTETLDKNLTSYVLIQYENTEWLVEAEINRSLETKERPYMLVKELEEDLIYGVKKGLYDPVVYLNKDYEIEERNPKYLEKYKRD